MLLYVITPYFWLFATSGIFLSFFRFISTILWRARATHPCSLTWDFVYLLHVAIYILPCRGYLSPTARAASYSRHVVPCIIALCASVCPLPSTPLLRSAMNLYDCTTVDVRWLNTKPGPLRQRTSSGFAMCLRVRHRDSIKLFRRRQTGRANITYITPHGTYDHPCY
jgi:hypothetical protein